MSRGQTFAVDFFIGVTIFLLLYGACTLMWQKTLSRLSREFLFEELSGCARRASDVLVLAPGLPVDWEQKPTAPVAVGLATSSGVMSRSKLGQVASLDEPSLRQYLGVGGH